MVRTVVVKVSVYKDTIGCYNSLRHAQGSLGASGTNILLYRSGQFWYRLSVSVVHINISNCVLDTLIWGSSQLLLKGLCSVPVSFRLFYDNSFSNSVPPEDTVLSRFPC